MTVITASTITLDLDRRTLPLEFANIGLAAVSCYCNPIAIRSESELRTHQKKLPLKVKQEDIS